MAGYSKEFLIDVYMYRFLKAGIDPKSLDVLEANANKFYDKVGRDTFRLYASVTPEAIREYKNA